MLIGRFSINGCWRVGTVFLHQKKCREPLQGKERRAGDAWVKKAATKRSSSNFVRSLIESSRKREELPRVGGVS